MLNVNKKVKPVKSTAKKLIINKLVFNPISNSITPMNTEITKNHRDKLCRKSSTLCLFSVTYKPPKSSDVIKNVIVAKSLILLSGVVNDNTKYPNNTEVELKMYMAGRIKTVLNAKSVKCEMLIPRIPFIKNRVETTPTDHTRAPLSVKAIECIFLLYV